MTRDERVVLSKIMSRHGIGRVLEELAGIFSRNNETHDLIFKETVDPKKHNKMVNSNYGTKGYTLTFRKGTK